MEFSPRELMDIQMNTLWTFDHDQHIESINEPGETAGPVIFIGVTQESVHIRFRKDVPVQIRHRCTQMISSIKKWEQPLSELIQTVQPVRQVWNGPAYVVYPQKIVEGITSITGENSDLLRIYFPQLVKGITEKAPIFAVIRGGAAVSVCYTARSSQHGAEAGVETAAPFRGKGLAASCVLGWADKIARSGRIPFYSTSFENKSSVALAKRLNLVQFGTDFHLS